MANDFSGAYAKKFLPVIDDIYKAQSITECLDADTVVDFSGANEVKILKVSTSGLGDYSRTSGYPKGDVTATWETMTLSEERGKELNVDRMDDEENLGMVFGSVVGSFMADQVVPELDAYRFAKYANTDGISSAAADLTSSDILEAIDTAVKQLDSDEVPMEGRKLFVNSDLKHVFGAAITRQWASDSAISTIVDSYNNMEVIYVPKSRFYTNITLADGSSSWGYSKATDAKNINFMIVYPQAVVQAKKIAMPKIFSPDENQDKDMWKFQFRLYHDAFVYSNKVKGIYLHTATV